MYATIKYTWNLNLIKILINLTIKKQILFCERKTNKHSYIYYVDYENEVTQKLISKYLIINNVLNIPSILKKKNIYICILKKLKFKYNTI